jgi:hypothetical protein
MSGGYPADMNRIADGVARVSMDGAAGAASGNDQNVPHAVINNPNGRAPDNATIFGLKSNGALRFHEFKDKLSDAFHFNRAVGCIFVASFNKRPVLDFFDELYLSYLMYFKTDPFKFVSPQDINGSLFNPANQYSLFKQFVVHPNLKYNGFFGFPVELGPKQVAEIWLKF